MSKNLADFIQEETQALNLDAGNLKDISELAKEVLQGAPLSVKVIKESVKETIDLPAVAAMAQRLPSLVAALESEDADEGPLAFREKREPNWKGR